MLRQCLAFAFLIICLVPIATGSRAQAQEDPLNRVYRLGTGDKLRVTVFDEKDLSGEFEVNAGGVIAMPLIGEVKARGLSLAELEQAITKKLLDGYLKSPRVNIEVLNYRPFYILGEVKNPGSYPFVSGMTVLNAVALAGGYTYRANKDRIYIQRPGEPDKDAIAVKENTPVLPGDILRVEERFF
jgi:protein involved in polysaccharide export with SLBB domain